MNGAIDNIKSGIASIATDVVDASGGDYQMGLVSFKDDVETDVDLAPGNAAAIQAGIAALTATDGFNLPEASDAALDTVVNGNSAGSDAGPCNAPFNSAGFRAGATKIAVLLTDNSPGGCNDTFTVDDENNAARVASDAAANNIRVSAIYNSDSPAPVTAGIMTNYAAETGGVYINTPGDGAGTSGAIQDIIDACGRSGRSCPLSQGYWKNHQSEWPAVFQDGYTIGGVFYTPWEILTILQHATKVG